MIKPISRINEQKDVINTKFKNSISRLDERVKNTFGTIVNFLKMANKPILSEALVSKKITHKESGHEEQALVECFALTCNMCCCCCAALLLPHQPAVYVRIA